jgi:hypothetical protein
MEQYFIDAQLGAVRYRDHKPQAHATPAQPRDIEILDDIPADQKNRVVTDIVTELRICSGHGAPKRKLKWSE